MKRQIIFIYSLLAYLFGLVTMVGFILFIAPRALLPWHIDAAPGSSAGYALFIDLLLLILFGLQHSIMARSGFKRWLCRIIPVAAERSSYVLLSGLVMAAMVLYWQPLAGNLWLLQGPLAEWLLNGLFILGWSIAVLSSFVINHFELFGLQQAWLHLHNRPAAVNQFSERLLYRFVRHPIQFGTLIGLWATPAMSLSHVLLAAGLSVYIFIGLYFEERDLVTSLGDDYRDYQQRVPKILPLPKAKSGTPGSP